MKQPNEMKAAALTATAILFSLAIGTLAQEIHDLRTVNDRQVDLAPVHKWLADHKGERPLPHWKQIQILSVQMGVGSWEKCKIKTEAGATIELYVANVPPAIKQFLASFAEDSRSIAALQAQIAQDEQRRDALWNRYVYTDSSVVSVTGGSRVPVVDDETTRHNQALAVDQRLRVERQQLAAMEASYESKVSGAKDQITTLAMFSGRKYSNVEIWDCGRK
jgi:hypothetical protein